MSNSHTTEPKDAAKTCVRCGRDCSHVPRVRDPQGKYACRTCAEQPPADVADNDDVINLLDEAVETAASPAAQVRSCPVCFRPMLAGAKVCAACGFDQRQGLQASTVVGKHALGRSGLTCASCGYGLRGLTKLRCPECGEAIKPRAARNTNAATASRVRREAYIRPLVMLLVGATLVTAIVFARGGPDLAAAYLLSYLVKVPIGVLMFFICCVVWIGFDAPLHLTALRLAGIYAAVDLAILLLGFSPVFRLLLQIVVGAALYIALLAEMLEIDVQDAFIVAILTFAAQRIAVLLLYYAMA